MKTNSRPPLFPRFALGALLLAAICPPLSVAPGAETAGGAVASPVAVLANENVDAAARQDVKKGRDLGRAIGAGIGAVGGYLIGRNNGRNNLEKGAIIVGAIGFGALVGDQLGKAIGERMAARRRQYASEQAFLESEIQVADTAIATRERKLAEAEAATRQRQAEIAQLEQSARLTQEQKAAATQLLAAVNAQIAENTRLLKEYQDAVAYLDETLKTSAPAAAATAAETAQWAEKKRQLEAKRAELVAQQDQLQGAGRALEIDQRRLLALAGH